MQLRYLQTLTEIGAEQNSTIIFPMPIDIIKPFLDLREKAAGKPAGANGDARVSPVKDGPSVMDHVEMTRRQCRRRSIGRVSMIKTEVIAPGVLEGWAIGGGAGEVLNIDRSFFSHFTPQDRGPSSTR